jgi:hypothetical protein
VLEFAELRFDLHFHSTRRDGCGGWLWRLVFLFLVHQVLNPEWLLCSANVKNPNVITVDTIVDPTWANPHLPIIRMRKLGDTSSETLEMLKAIGRVDDPADHAACCLWLI